MKDPFDFFYQERDTEISKLLGENYKPEKRFEYGKDIKIATLLSDNDDDGQDVIIYECRMPARFFKIKVLDTHNSVGDIQKGYMVSTGSSCDRLVYDIATAINQGMLGIEC